MTRLLTDSFTEASDKLLSAHAPDLGGTWSSFSGATMTVLAAEGRARGSDAASGAVYYNTAANAANVSVIATVRRTSAAINEGNPGLVARLQAGADNRYFAYHNGSQLVLFKRAAGVSTTLATATPAFAVDTDAAMELRLNGADIQLLWNGAVAIAVSDTAVSGAGYGGVTARLNGRVDDATIDTIFWTLAPARAVHATSSDATALGVTYALAPADGTHADRAGSAALTVTYALAPSGATQATSADAALVSIAYALGPVTSALPLTSDAPLLRPSLSPPGAGIAQPVTADPRAMRIASDPRTQEIHHG